MQVNQLKDTIHKEDNKRCFKILGQGNTAEIYQYSEHKILKLFRENMPFEAISNEYQKSLMIQEHLENVPKVFQLVEYRDRYGIVYEQILGQDMIQVFLKHPLKIKYYSQMLASVHVSMHQEVMDLNVSAKSKLCHDINASKELTTDEKETIMHYLEKLPDENYLCHFDFHPGNVIFRNNQLVVIDWMTACTGNKSADVLRTVLLLQMGELMHVSSFTRTILHVFMKKIGKAYLKGYMKQTGITLKEINAWRLPVAAARLSEWLTEHEREKLVLLVREELSRLVEEKE